MDFPSTQFYNGELCVGDSFTQEAPSMLNIWPGGPKQPIVFCHVDGHEKTLPVSAAEGGLDSKSNPAEQKHMVT